MEIVKKKQVIVVVINSFFKKKMRYKTIHLVGYGFLLQDKGEFEKKDSKYTWIQTPECSFLGVVKEVKCYYHDWFHVRQLGLESEFQQYKIQRLEDKSLDLIPKCMNRKKNHVIFKLNAIRNDFSKMEKKVDKEDLFELFCKMVHLDLPLEIVRMIYDFHSDIGYYKVSIFV